MSPTTSSSTFAVVDEPAFRGNISKMRGLKTKIERGMRLAGPHLTTMNQARLSYESDQKSPDVTTIVEAAETLSAALAAFIDSYDDLKTLLTTAIGELEDVKADSDTNWTAVQSNATEQFNYSMGYGDAPTNDEALLTEWKRIRDLEDEIYRQLAADTNAVDLGASPSVDQAGLDRLTNQGVIALDSSSHPDADAWAEYLKADRVRSGTVLSNGDQGDEELEQLDRLVDSGITAEEASGVINSPDDVVEAVIDQTIDLDTAKVVAELKPSERRNVFSSELESETIRNIFEGEYGSFTYDALLIGDTGTQPEFDKLDTRPGSVLFGVEVGELTVSEAAVVELPTDELNATQDNLGDDWRGVTEGDLNNTRDRFEGLDGWQVDWILTELDDDEVETLIDNVEGSGWFSNDWSGETENHFYSMVGEKVSIDSWHRLGTYTERINPDPLTAKPDTARDDPKVASDLGYQLWQGPLFDDTNGIDFDDPNQGSIGDCYLIAGMIALSHDDPSTIEDMIQPNPNGTFTVTFGDGSKQVVSPYFVTSPSSGNPGSLEFSHPGPAAEQNEMWPMVIEKAYAQQEGGWGDIVGGSQSAAIEDLTGRESGWIDADDVSLDDLSERAESGEILGLSTIDRPEDMTGAEWKADPDTPSTFKGTDPQLAQNHAYVVVAVNEDSIEVLNPWNPEQPPIVLTEDELVESINGVRVNEAP